jgi:hypothetical protein
MKWLITVLVITGCQTLEEGDEAEKANSARMLYSQCMSELNACKQQHIHKGRGPK